MNSYAPAYIQIDPTYCPIIRRRKWEDYENLMMSHPSWLNYHFFAEPRGPPSLGYMRTALRQIIHIVRDNKPNIACRMMHKICLMLSAVINTFKNTEMTKIKWTTFLEGHKALIFNLNDTPKMKVIYGIFSRLEFLPSHYMQTFEEAFCTGYFEIDSQLFMPICKDLKAICGLHYIRE